MSAFCGRVTRSVKRSVTSRLLHAEKLTQNVQASDKSSKSVTNSNERTCIAALLAHFIMIYFMKMRNGF